MKKVKPSRQRRIDAVNAAKAEVYKNSGAVYDSGMNPYDVITNERQHRIFEKYYITWYNTYHYYEDVLNSM